MDDPSLNALPGIAKLYLVILTVVWMPIVFASHADKFAFDVACAAMLPLRGLFDTAVALYLVWKGRKWRSKMRSAGVEEGDSWWEELDSQVLRRLSLSWVGEYKNKL